MLEMALPFRRIVRLAAEPLLWFYSANVGISRFQIALPFRRIVRLAAEPLL